jgi:nicotinate-nucleotide adenylyltransferase
MADESQPPITPVPLPPKAQNVVLFGGTFDPPHLGHVRVPLQVLNRAMPTGTFLLYVPAAKSPLKENGPEASDADRLEMLQLCLTELSVDTRVAVWTDELDRARASPGPSYTIDTVRRLREGMNPEVNIRLLVGADQALDFHRWRSAADLLKEAPPLVMLRDPIRTTALFEAALRSDAARTGPEVEAWLARVVETGFVDISSSELRRRLHECRTTGAPPGSSLRSVLGEGVLNYIGSRGLYR